MRVPPRFLRSLLASAGVALAAAPALRAQPVVQMSVTGADASPATKAALTGSLILAGAAGAQLIKTPKAWDRTWQGFGYRVADQSGFYLVQTTSFRALGRALDYRQDAVLCPRDGLVGCAFTATFTAFDREGRRRVNTPLVTSILVGTGASLLWRPERHDNGESWAFVGTRLGIAFGGYVAERILVDWWAQRN
ncbi:hypothetical protein Strain138_002732 [Pseudogemmatithrix spongiicola]|uniref:Uncharacterized protein n=1 Tax=Pseudogemmatithrix spongiicola TaxID=3062599 RepID=A0AA49Q9H8_9BACT|nr:hypothetical protein Strain138_002732 [Gemmatimonadaceae bacterium 'strain 138']WKW16320.1 hypothetical protein Strain318_002732 [Gemmatimonadaceae bacterium 'strain 318']